MLTIRPVVLICAIGALALSTSAQQLHQGYFEPFGRGCPATDNAIFEVFPRSAFDLEGASLEWVPNGRGSYTVSAGGGWLAFGAGTDTQATSQQVSVWPLGFTFSYPGGSTTSMYLAPAGYVRLAAGGTDPCCGGSIALPEFLSGAPSFAVLGQNLHPAAGGTIWIDSATIAGRQVAYVTWDSVPEGFSSTTLNTCQLQLWDDGHCVMCWNGIDEPSVDTLVGWSAGGGQPDHGSHDLSCVPIDGGDGVIRLPVTFGAPSNLELFPGVSVQLGAAYQPASIHAARLGAMLYGSPGAVAVPLDAIGMEKCTLLSAGDLFIVPVPFNVEGNPNVSVSLPWDAPASVFGQQFDVQVAFAAPGVNALGVVLSNAYRIRVGEPGRAVPDPASGIVILADGTDTFDTDPSAGFWSVEHADPNRPPITAFTIDFEGARFGPARLHYFDVDEPMLRFDAGNSTLPGCAGAYRNGSDVTTGLIYPGTPAAPCDPLANQGWVGLHPLLPGQYRGLTFRFAHFEFGEKFEFDCDTDGFGAIYDFVDGTVVTLEFADGSTASGDLARALFRGRGVTAQIF